MLILFEGPNGVKDTLRFIEEKGHAGLWKWDLTTDRMEWSNGMYRLLGVEPGTVSPNYETLQQLLHPDDVRTRAEMESVLANAGSTSRGFRVMLPNGRVRWLSCRGDALFDKTGRPYCAIGVVFEDTVARELKAASDIIQARLASILQAVQGSAWTSTPSGAASEVSGWCALTGQSPTEALGDGWVQAIHAEHRATTLAAWMRAIKEGTPYEHEYPLRTRSGQYRWVSSRAVPLRNEDGMVREWVGLTLEVQSAGEKKTSDRNKERIAGPHLRAARALLDWAVHDLAQHANVSPATIRRLEATTLPAAAPEPSLIRLMTTLEQHGVEFVGTPDGDRAVRLKPMQKLLQTPTRLPSEGLRPAPAGN